MAKSVASLRALRDYADDLGYKSAGEQKQGESETELHEFLGHLKSIGAKTQRKHQLCLETDDREWESKSFDVTRATQLRSNTHVTDVLSQHIERVHEQRQELASRLQQPFIGEFVAVETGSHAQFSQLLHTACSDAAGATQPAEAWEWVKKAEPIDDQWTHALAEVPAQLASLERYHNALSSVHKAASKLYETEVTE